MYITEKKLLKWALYSNAIYIFLYFIFRPQGINITKIVITSFLLFSVISLIFICYKNRKQLKEIPRFPRILFYLLIFYSCIIIIRSFSLSVQDWVTNFGNVYMGLTWLTPIVLILGLKIENWSVVFKTIFFMFQLMLFLFAISFFYNAIYTDWVWLLRPVNFILLVGLYHFRLIDRIKTYFIIVIYIITVAVFTSRRVDLLFLGITLGFILLDKLVTIKIKKSFLKYILFAFIIVFTLIFTIGYEFISNAIASIIDFQDSRTFLYTELFEDLTKSSDLFFGRGSLGTYYSGFMEHTKRYIVEILKMEWWGDASDRITIEVGYLQMVLKGGFVMLLLNIVLYIYTIYLALFKSNNKFITRLGYYILIISILSMVELVPRFTPVFIMFWIAIGTVLNKKNRLMNNEEIENLINFK